MSSVFSSLFKIRPVIVVSSANFTTEFSPFTADCNIHVTAFKKKESIHTCIHRETRKNTQPRIQHSTLINILWDAGQYSCASYWSISLPSAASKASVNSLVPIENTARYSILLCSGINRCSTLNLFWM